MRSPTMKRERSVLLPTLAFVVGTALVACFLLVAPATAAGPVPCPVVMAHRGDTDVPDPATPATENSLAAFAASFAAGTSWVETDIQFTSDDVPVLMHDATVDRTTDGTGPVSAMTAAQFTVLTLDDGQHPPTLAQVLDLLRGHPERHLIAEVKTATAAQAPLLLPLLLGMEGQVYLNAFPAYLTRLQALKTADPLLTVSLLANSPVLPAPAGISGEDLDYPGITVDAVAQLHAAGLTVRAWVADAATEWLNLSHDGVDAIMTNRTASYVAWAASGCPVHTPPSDQTSPTASMSEPADGSLVSGHLQVTGNASDDVGVTTALLVVDDDVLATGGVDADGQVTLDWNTSTVPDGPHRLQLRARDAAGNVGESEVRNVVVENDDVVAPSPPGDVSATWAPPGEVTLAWSAASDDGAVTGYRVHRDGAVIATLPADALGYTDGAVSDLASYDYEVTALDAAGNESDPSDALAVTAGDATPPTTPAARAALSGTTSALVSWAPSSDNAAVTGYRVRRDSVVVATVDGTTASALDTGLAGGVSYTYTVEALDAAGNASSPSAAVTIRTPDLTPPNAPTKLARTISGSTVRLTWTAPSDNVGVVGYTVYRAGTAIGTSTGTTYTDTTGVPGRTYAYTVRARDAAGNISAASSAVSATLPADKTAPKAPSGLKAVAGATGTKRVTLTWKAATDNIGVTAYYVYRNNAADKLLGNVLTFTDTGLKAGTKYTYKVYALDAAGNRSPASSSVTATAR